MTAAAEAFQSGLRPPRSTDTQRRREVSGRPEAPLDELDAKARARCQEIILGTGPIGERMRVTGEAPLRTELLTRTNNNPFLARMAEVTERALPAEHFRREDGNTPHVRHSYRVALLLQDLLVKSSMPIENQITLLGIALGHDNEEEAQEALIKGKPGGKTQAESWKFYKTEMTGMPIDQVEATYAGLHLLNRWNADNTKKDNDAYLEAILDADPIDFIYAMVKVADIDSAHGDMARIVGVLHETLRIGSKTMPDGIDTLYERMDKSVDKARVLARVLGPNVPEAFQEELAVTIRAGELFRGEIAKAFEAGKITGRDGFAEPFAIPTLRRFSASPYGNLPQDPYDNPNKV